MPPQWTGPHGLRLADAWRVLSRMPWRALSARIRPLVAALSRGVDRLWPCWAGELEAMQREANRTRVLPTSREISKWNRRLAGRWIIWARRAMC
jgi:hypothetical protein